MDVSPATPRIAVIGVGNDYRRDDGVGWAVVAGLAQRPLPHGTRLTITDGEPTRLINAWDGADLAILVDAARVPPARPHPPAPAPG
ncbi:hydrogenase maturation protease [Streptomyces platensis]|uniref:hydrogenase maturation protease n=1 Tax=Streptomyces platensis TaxID=58346 RepID=UPI00386F7A72